MGATADTEADLLSGLSAEKDSQHTAACGEIKGCMLIHRRQDGFRLPSALHSTRISIGSLPQNIVPECFESFLMKQCKCPELRFKMVRYLREA